MKVSILHCILLSFVVNNAVFSQTPNEYNYSQKFVISTQNMHVHFDKDIYMPGETIWFKAYLYNVNEVSLSSTNFYAAVYNEQGKLIQQKQYPILEGSSYGDFELPDTLQGSRLQFRAFTKTMIDEDSSNVYERILTVYNKEKNTDSIINKTISLQFFPEGGEAIAELENQIGFKAVYSDGSPAMVKGQIIEVESHKTVNNFSTDKTGMGKLMLIPAPRKTYIAIWQNEKADTITTALPKVSRYGVSFHAEIEDKALEYILAKNISSDSLSILHLQAQMGNYKVYKADLIIPEEMQLSKAKFSIDSLPAGLLQLSLFDKHWDLLQERLIFIHEQDIAKQLTINRDTINSKPKGKNTIELVLPDTLFTNLSVSIADINFYEQPQTHGIKQELLFNTQLYGLNQNADALLNNNRDNIDLLTLTHPWKKYSWQKALDKKEARLQPADDYLSLTINYKEKDFALPKEETLNLIISNKGKDKQYYNVLPASKTSFKQTGMIFFDSTKVDYQLNKNKELISYITVNKDALLTNPLSVNPLPERISYSNTKAESVITDLDSFFIPKHKKFNDVQTIGRVVVKAKYKGNPQLERIDELDKFYTTGMFSGNKGYQLNVIDDTLGANVNFNLQDYIRYRVPGLILYKGTFRVRRMIHANNPDRFVDSLCPVPVFIDEIRSDGGDGIQSDGEGDESLLNMWNVAYVKYIPGIVIGGSFRSDVGAIYIYTKKGTEKDPPGKGIPYVYIKGYDLQKEFISPDYGNKDLLKETDLRSTLYWNPNITLNKINSKFKIEYYNNDVSKKLLLTIEGFNAGGKLIHIEKIIE